MYRWGQEREICKAVVFKLLKNLIHGDHNTLNLLLDFFMGHDPQIENIHGKTVGMVD